MNPFNAPPAFVHIRNWLGHERVQWFLNYARERRALFRGTTVNSSGGRRDDSSFRVSHKISPVPEIAAEIEPRVRDILPDLFRKLGTTPFIPRAYGTELIAHGDGAFARRHRDTRGGPLIGIYYFHQEPKRFSGGVLRLYSMDRKNFADVEPENDSVVFFPPWFPHEVLPVSCPSKDLMDSRFAINC